MIFTVRDLGFEIGPFLLEGWWALAARAVCAAVTISQAVASYETNFTMAVSVSNKTQ